MDKPKEAVLSGHVRHLLLTHKYSGPRCADEFGVGITWYSAFMRGGHRPKPEVLEAIYEKIHGHPLLPLYTPTQPPVGGFRVRRKKGAEQNQ